MKPIIRFVITDTYMGLSHDGLAEVIRQMKKKNPLFAKTMAEGGLVLFVNRQKTRIKLFSEESEVIGYLRLPSGRILDESVVHLIPDTFGGSVTFAGAVKKALQAFVDQEKRTARVSPISKARLYSEAV